MLLLVNVGYNVFGLERRGSNHQKQSNLSLNGLDKLKIQISRGLIIIKELIGFLLTEFILLNPKIWNKHLLKAFYDSNWVITLNNMYKPFPHRASIPVGKAT